MSSYSEAQKEKLEKKRKTINGIMLIPIVLMLAVVPLIVRQIYVYPKDVRMNILFSLTSLVDYYSQYKSTAIIILAVIMLVFFYLFIEKSEIKLDGYSKLYLGSGMVLLLMTIVSTVLSEYKEISVWGVYDRSEGMVMWCCYLLMMFYTFYVIRNDKGYKWIVGALIFLVTIITILGIFQYAGYDLLTKTKLGVAFVIPKDLRADGNGISSEYASHKVLGTMYHYDYVGSFGAMMVPFFVMLTMLTKGVKKKIILGVTTLAALFVLLGSTSRAGLVGTILAGIMGVIIFGREIVIHWKKSLPIGIVLIAILLGLNFATGGSIFARIPTLIEDAVSLFRSTDKEFDYRDYIPVREVLNEDGKVTLVLQQDQLTIGYEQDQLQFVDGAGKKVSYTAEATIEANPDGSTVEGNNYSTQDERFSNVKMLVQNINVFSQTEAIKGMLITVSGNSFFCFKLDESGVNAIDPFSGDTIKIADADYIGFHGKEKLGSARGYIWSRAMSVFVKRNLLIGNGPDTFIAYFPSTDVLARWWAYGMPNVLVDKPHNLYLQIGMNQGGVALLAFLILIMGYIIQCLRLYAFRKEYSQLDALGIGCMLAIIGYLGAGFFNDSIVSVAPIFWILLGTGMGANYFVQKSTECGSGEKASKIIKINQKKR